MKKKIKLISTLLTLLIGIGVVILSLFSPRLILLMEKVIYWLVFLLIINLIWIFRLKGNLTLLLAFSITVVGAIVNIFAFDLSEIILRLGYLFWIIAVLQILFKSDIKE